jgi:dCMP deaminase
MNWQDYFVDLTLAVASKSKDPSRKVGCIIVGPDKEIRSTGFNGFPRGVNEMVEVKHTPHFLCEQEYDIREIHIKQRCNCGHIDNDQNDLGLGRHISEAPTGTTEELIPDRWERPAKYQYVEHAERNAIYNAARVGTPTLGCSVFVSLAPCVGCTRALIQAGITKVYGPAFDHSHDDIYHFDTAEVILKESGVEYVVTDYEK